MAKNLTQEEIQQKLQNDPDFIFSSKYNNSIEQIIEKHPLEKYPNRVPDKIIAKVLVLESPEEVESIYQGIVRKLRKKMSLED